MSKNCAVFLADGFEEVEALSSVDVLRRAGFHVTTYAVKSPTTQVRGAHGVPVLADQLESEYAFDCDLTVFPGGLPGATNLAESVVCQKAARTVLEQGGIASAICAAPLALHSAGVLQGHQYTCYPGFEAKIGGNYRGGRVVRDGNVITACGPGASLEFALELVRALGKPEIAEQLKNGMLLP